MKRITVGDVVCAEDGCLIAVGEKRAFQFGMGRGIPVLDC